MINKTLFTIICLILVLSSFFVFGSVGAYGRPIAELTEGRNLIQINASLYVSDLVYLNPDLEAISYFDENRQSTIGFVKAMGGVGSNFLIVPDREYEIYVSRNITLLVP